MVRSEYGLPLRDIVRRCLMLKYGVAWLLGVPLGLLIIIYLIFHLL